MLASDLSWLLVVPGRGTVSGRVIVLALARMWRLVDQVRLLTEQRGRTRLAAMVEHSSDVVLARRRKPGSSAMPALVFVRCSDTIPSARWAPCVDIVGDDERESAERHFARLIEAGHGGTVEFDTSIVRADGQHRKATVVIANLLGGEAIDGDRRDLPRCHRTTRPGTPAQPSCVPRRAHRARQPCAVSRSNGSCPSRCPTACRPGGGVVRRSRRLQVGERRARPRGGRRTA